MLNALGLGARSCQRGCGSAVRTCLGGCGCRSRCRNDESICLDGYSSGGHQTGAYSISTNIWACDMAASDVGFVWIEMDVVVMAGVSVWVPASSRIAGAIKQQSL